MDPMTWLQIAAAAGRMMNEANAEKDSKTIRAAEIRGGPWSRQAPSTQVRFANPAGTVADAASSYLQQQQTNTAQKEQKKLWDSQLAMNAAQQKYIEAAASRMVPTPVEAPAAAPQAPQIPAPGAAPMMPGTIYDPNTQGAQKDAFGYMNQSPWVYFV